MIQKLKENVLHGYYVNHPQGEELLSIDLEAVLQEHEVQVALENVGLVSDNKQFVKEVEDLKNKVIKLKEEINTHQEV